MPYKNYNTALGSKKRSNQIIPLIEGFYFDSLTVLF